jgi:hypothetical protein
MLGTYGIPNLPFCQADEVAQKPPETQAGQPASIDSGGFTKDAETVPKG